MPQITAIEPQERHKDRVSVFVDGKFTLGIFADVAATLGLRVGQTMTAERLEEIAGAETRRRAREDAYRLLSFRARSEQEIAERLRQKGYEDEVIADTMTSLQQQGFVNDEDFANSWVSARGKTRGRQALSHELRQKGIARETAQEILETRTPSVEREAARAAAIKRVGERPTDQSREAKARLAGYLARRGFGWGIIKPVLNELYGFSDTDDDELTDE